jgi:hypothetical protein
MILFFSWYILIYNCSTLNDLFYYVLFFSLDLLYWFRLRCRWLRLNLFNCFRFFFLFTFCCFLFLRFFFRFFFLFTSCGLFILGFFFRFCLRFFFLFASCWLFILRFILLGFFHRLKFFLLTFLLFFNFIFSLRLTL